MKKYLTTEFLLSCFVYLTLFLYFIFPYRDYDWGWHYKYGEYFFTYGKILKADPFSWTAAGFEWINHSWLYDLLVFVIFKNLSFFGMSLAAGIVMITAFYLLIKPFKLSYWQKALLAFPFYILCSGVVFQALRSQVIGLLFICTLYYLLIKATEGKLYAILFLPVYFLIWTNFHGSFSYGLIVYILFLTGLSLSQIAKTKKLSLPRYTLYLLIAFPFCALATLVNPYGIEIYQEVLRHSNNRLLRLVIEWGPVEFFSDFYNYFALYTAIIISGILITTVTNKNRLQKFLTFLPYLLIALLAIYMASTARRYMPLYVIATIPMAAMMLKNLKLEKYQVTKYIVFAALAIYFQVALFQRIPVSKPFQFNWLDYCRESSSCSETATRYLIKNPPQGTGFNFYDWGGYLIGRGFPVKLFTDGRMHLWKTTAGFEPYAAYWNIYYQNDLKTFKQFDIQWILVPTGSTLAKTIAENKAFGKWEIKYQDKQAVYFVRQN